MELVGLVPSDTGEPGGKKTGQRITHYIATNGPFARAFASMPKEYLLPWSCIAEQDAAGSGSSVERLKVKYSCPLAHGNVWGKPDLSLVCGLCGNPYEPE